MKHVSPLDGSTFTSPQVSSKQFTIIAHAGLGLPRMEEDFLTLLMLTAISVTNIQSGLNKKFWKVKCRPDKSKN